MARGERGRASAWRRILALAALAALACLAGCNRVETESDAAQVAKPPNLFLVVLDTVRRDRVEPCGYDKPTTPTLSLLASRATTFCRTIVPGSWTAPVHASMFTGLLPSEHGLDYLPVGEAEEGDWNDVSRMDAEVPTLAGILAEHGYQTVLVSANPVLNDVLGTNRGFDRTYVNPGVATWRGRPALGSPYLEKALAELDPEKPVFLFLNIFIAHNPYEYVPEGIGWVDSTPDTLDLFYFGDGDEQDSPFARYVSGALSPEEETELLRQVHAGYDWGVRLADQDLAVSLEMLSRGGWLVPSSTLVVTSDHGELLGEHRMLNHGGVLYRSNLDVFTMVGGPGFEPGRRVDSLVQSQDVFPTLLSAAGIEPPQRSHAVPMQRPVPDRVAVTMSLHNAWHALYSEREGRTGHMVAVQRGEERVLWREGKPGSSHEVLSGEHVPGVNGPEIESTPARDLVDPTLEFARAWTGTTRKSAELSPEMRERLKALGYVD